MTKRELMNRFATRAGIKPIEAELIVSSFFEAIQHALSNGGRVEIRGFGTFHTKTKKARSGRNPKTGNVININEKTFPCFKPGRRIRQLLDGF